MDVRDIETDFLGDLRTDTHGIWEVFETVRGKRPNLTDTEVFDIGRSLIHRWITNGWIVLSDKPLYPTTIRSLDEALSQLDTFGATATKYFENAPSIDIAVGNSEPNPNESSNSSLPPSWPFSDAPNTAVFTTTRVLVDGAPILHVIHEASDGAWQFHASEPVRMEDAMIVALQEMLEHDSSLSTLADLPLGWEANRRAVTAEWVREPLEEEVE